MQRKIIKEAKKKFVTKLSDGSVPRTAAPTIGLERGDPDACTRNSGLDSKLEEIWRRIEDPSVGIIGSYGMEGAAKTALLKEIYNKIEVECLPPELALQLFQFCVERRL
ncbi:hypothetical protein GH714_024178 [Hevea brasiliensis]|uniref:NB-ARC domain-containing protein n=1 Tax=Hevea brasiliensis TaxID=3981 RepID=A0A6A6LJ08_HEVBR|nr:hypothetical protein GH714_024178 [Hevea brasiliensis]